MKLLKFVGIALLLMFLSLFGYMKVTGENSNELSLNLLSWVKEMKGNAVDLSTLGQGDAPLADHQLWTKLLQTHVDLQGRVNYEGLLNDRLRLEEYTQALSAHPPGADWSEQERLAYWINSYNAFTVLLIIDHYPLKTIKEIRAGLPIIDSPWDLKFFKIGTVDFDLNTIEHEILRKQFNEPRIHFAINCASCSCPKLRNEAYESQRLEVQMEEQAKEFVSDPTKNNITASEIKLSKIFSWFENDFTKSGSINSYLKRYTDDISEEHEVSYMDYNWSLNK